MIGKILRWGNSYGIRLSKGDVESAGLREGDEVAYDYKALPRKKIDNSDLRPLFRHGSLSVDHDREDWA